MIHRFLIALLIFSFALFALNLSADDAELAENWHQWRGPLGNGAGPDAKPPLTWGPDQNVQWKIAIPGHGSSSPIVWGNRVIVLSAEKVGGETAAAPASEGGRRGGRGGGRNSPPPSEPYRFQIHCIDRATGKIVWQQVAIEAVPHEGHHNHHGYASPSPVTDGKRIIASFGSRGIFGYDFDGKKLWERDLGDMKTRNSFGEGSSPALHDGLVFVQWDHEGADKFYALDANTGEIRWQADRDEPSVWATPHIARQGDVTHVIANGTNRVRSYDSKTGTVLWSHGGQTVNVIPSPVSAAGIAYVMSGFHGATLRAIKLEARGDLPEGDPAIVWKHDDSTPYVPSPLLYNDKLYFFSGNKNILSVLNAPNGEVIVKPRRIEGLVDIYASPVGAANKVYIVDRDGTTVVLDQSPEAKVLATNKMEEPIDASPALAGNQMFLRGAQNLYCISEAKK